MLSISLKVLETFSVFFFLKQGCAQAESVGPNEHSGFYRFRELGPLQFSLSNEFLCLQISSMLDSEKRHFCDIINFFTILSFRIMWIVSNLAIRETGIKIHVVNN